MNRNSEVIICKNIKLDKSYKNVLDYTENQMLSLCREKQVASASNFSFIRKGESMIDVPFSYENCLKCNYLAFQNPSYSNKWFFAFIDEVEYRNDSTTRLTFTVDEFSTWFDYWDPKTCFVIREHVTNDAVGLHTVPEGLETGEYISTQLQPTNVDYDGGTCYCVTTTDVAASGYSTFNETIPSGLYYHGFTTTKGVQEFIDLLKDDSIVNSVFVCPKAFFSDWKTQTGIDGQFSTSVRYTLNNKSISVTHVDYLGNNYVPKNNKLKCFPYSYLQVSNHSGTVVNYNWEDFNLLPVGTTGINFTLGCALSPGCSGYAYPVNYKNILNNYDDGIAFGKFPVGGWNSDTYTNWLTQNGVNTAIGVVGGVAAAGLGVAGAFVTGGTSLAITGAVIGGGISIASSVGSIYQHSLAPDQTKGNTNTGDFNFGYNWLRLEFKRMSIKDEYARIIDDVFTRTGYKINQLKLPNQKGRPIWNYVQIGDKEEIGYSVNENCSVPTSSMEIINNIYRSGVTIWHNHVHVGNYALDNTL